MWQNERGKGSDELLLLTNRIAIYAKPGNAGSLTAHDVKENPPREDLNRFDSYLGRGTVIFDVPSESR